MNMSKNLRVGLSVLLLIGVVAAVAAPRLVGDQVEKDFRQVELDIAKKSSVPVTVKPVSYNRGWFSSDAVSVYDVSYGSQISSITVNHHINQFPIPFKRWLKITHTIIHTDFGDLAISFPVALEASTEKLMNGGYSTHIFAPEIAWGAVNSSQMNVKNLTMDFNASEDHQQQIKLSVPSFAMKIANSPVSFKLVNLSYNVSESDMETAQLPWRQHIESKLESMEVSTAGQPAFTLSDMQMNSDIKDNGDNVDLIYTTNIGKSKFGASNSAAINDIKINFSYQNLNKNALLKIATVIKTINGALQNNTSIVESPLAQQQVMKEKIGSIIQQSGDLITNSPSFKIDQLSMKTSYGDLAGNFELHINGTDFVATDLNTDNFAPMIKARLYGLGQLTMTRNTLQHSNDTASAKQQQQTLENVIKIYVAQGYLLDDGKTLTMNASFGPAGLDLNGKHVM